MKWWEVIEEHESIRNTCGYEAISKVDVIDVPQFLQFLKICNNYMKMDRKNQLK